MTALATLLVIAFLAYLVHHYAPRRADHVFRIERFRAPGPLTDWSTSYYENQRQYSDLAAIYGRSDVPDPDLRGAERSGATAPVVRPSTVEKASPVHLRKTGLVNGNLSAPGGRLAV